jgi:tetratricopeptide (TPR) repeat protein
VRWSANAGTRDAAEGKVHDVPMTDDLYERYKEALRVGHVAVLRGSLNAAVDAYRNAAEIAPSRALPHTSLGGVLLRLGRLSEALVEYAAAVARAPHDEGALLGQAEALSTAGQRVDAALALDQVAEIQVGSGRLPEAADTLRRAIEFHETEERSRRQRELLRQIRLSAGDHAAEQLLARALRLRDEPAATVPPVLLAVSPPAPVVESPEPVYVAPQPEAEDVRSDAVPVAAGEAVEVEPAEAIGPAAVEPAEVAESVEAVTDEAAAGAFAVEASDEPAEAMEVEIVEPVEPAASGERESSPAWSGWWRDEASAQPSNDRQPAEEPVAESEEAIETPAEEPVAASLEDAGSEEGVEGAAATVSDEQPSVVEIAAAAPPPSVEALPAEIELAVLAAAAKASPEAPVVGVMETLADAGSGNGQGHPSGDELLAAAEAADLSGDATTLRSLLLWAARAYAREGRFEVALDAAHRLLRAAPSDVDTHLVLVELYMARDWNALAAEKLALLERLAVLSGDEDTRKRVCTMASKAFPRDERLGALCS